MSENPKWFSLLDNNKHVRRRRIDDMQLDVWHPLDRINSEHPTRGCKNICALRTYFETELSEFSPPIRDDEISYTIANNDIGLSIVDNSTKVCGSLVEFPFTRTSLSSRLATLVRRVRSDMVVRLHTHTIASGANNSQTQVFTANLVFFPSSSRPTQGHIVAAVVNGDILVIPTSSIIESQWEHLKQANLQKLPLLITLTPPWKELVLPGSEQQQKRIIISTSSANIQVLPREISAPVQQRIPLLCDCIQKDPTGATWYSCTYRFGCKATKLSTAEQLCASGSNQFYILVLHKSLLWFQKRLKIAFLVKLSNGSLSLLLFSPSVYRQCPLRDGDEAGTSGRVTIDSVMNPGCVYSVKKLPVVATASDTGLTRNAQKLWSSLSDFLKRIEGLAQFMTLGDAPNELDLFILKKAAKFNLVLEMTAFSESTVLPPYSPPLSSSSRCILTGVLLYEFPSGSLIAERILAGNQGTPTDRDDHQLATVFVILTESTHSQGAVHLVLCSADAVTPLTILISSDHLSPCVALDYGQHRSYRIRVSIVGAIAAHGFFILDEFGRVELTEVVRLSEGRLEHTRNCPLPGLVEGLRRRNASLITMAGAVLDVDSSSSQVWPLCTGCLSDALKQKLPSARPPSTHLECSRCQARIDRPFHAVEIFVELIDTVQRRRCKVCILPSCFAEITGLSEAQIYQSSFLDPRLLIGQSVSILLGLSIKLPELESQVALSDCRSVIIQLHPNMLT
ncbi:hypothetical protein TcWFU_007550 [Taenia crassiceps]|uniref:DUF4503 domain-containing protein n=1 Tax=Taenia crassiceps TaxID=6207 RepID=A0ABR4Q791_9CEST